MSKKKAATKKKSVKPEVSHLGGKPRYGWPDGRVTTVRHPMKPTELYYLLQHAVRLEKAACYAELDRLYQVSLEHDLVQEFLRWVTFLNLNPYAGERDFRYNKLCLLEFFLPEYQ